MSEIDDLERLKNMKENGALSNYEYEIEKSKILNSTYNEKMQREFTFNSPFAKGSLICAVVSLFVFPYIFGIAAIILAVISFANLEEKKKTAIAGIIIGIIGILWAYNMYMNM